MPRLSIIVPHRHNDSRLEDTLVSLLENRPADSEIIVVHDGSYNDQYDLGDEVVFVCESGPSSTLRKLNAGLMAACAPAVCVLLDGVRVAPNWSDAAVATVLESQAATASVAIEYNNNVRSLGIDARIIRRTNAARRGQVEVARFQQPSAGPVLACGFYRRKALLALGGWNEDLDEAVADVELALAFNSQGLTCEQDCTSSIFAMGGRTSRGFSAKATSQLASVLAAHGAVATGLFDALKGILTDCLSGQFLSSLAWSAGLRDANTIRRTQLRLAHLRQQLGEAKGQSLRIYPGDAPALASERKAA